MRCRGCCDDRETLWRDCGGDSDVASSDVGGEKNDPVAADGGGDPVSSSDDVASSPIADAERGFGSARHVRLRSVRTHRSAGSAARLARYSGAYAAGA